VLVRSGAAGRARTRIFGGLSGHAGQRDLLRWFGSMASSRPRLILTHGEGPQRKAMRDRVEECFGAAGKFPGYRETLEC